MNKLSTFIFAGLLTCGLLYSITADEKGYDLQGVGREEKHVCADRTHESCDGGCECDGLGCPFSEEGGDK